MDLDRQLRKGPLRVRALWDAGQTELLAERVLKRRRRRVAARAAAAASLAAAITLALLAREAEDAGGMPASAPTAATSLAAGAQSLERTSTPAAATGKRSPRDRALVLSDGSRVELLGDATEVSLERDAPREARATLRAGEAAFAVVPNAERVFELSAGPVRVLVLGTRFTVQLRDARARVAVSQGSVEVRWGSHAARVLTAGEAQWFPPAPATRAETPAVRRTSGTRMSPPGKVREATPGPRDTPAGLMLAADAARRSGHHRQAVDPLRRVLRRYPNDRRAPLAAFTLGRVLAEELGEHAAAGEAFAEARRLAPGGPLASDALSREIEARERAGETARARALAAEYLELYPAGRHGRRYERLRSPE